MFTETHDDFRPITINVNNAQNQSQLEEKTCTKRGKTHSDQFTNGFGFVSDWMKGHACCDWLVKTVQRTNQNLKQKHATSAKRGKARSEVTSRFGFSSHWLKLV